MIFITLWAALMPIDALIWDRAKDIGPLDLGLGLRRDLSSNLRL
jgi:hypothetical protein